LEVEDLDSQFADGVFLVLLVGLLEGYFVPLHEFFLTPQASDLIHNKSSYILRKSQNFGEIFVAFSERLNFNNTRHPWPPVFYPNSLRTHQEFCS
jgi:hypothetical protein